MPEDRLLSDRTLLTKVRDEIADGITHVGMEGPNARWHGEGEDIWYDHDIVCAPACPACALVAEISDALDEEDAD